MTAVPAPLPPPRPHPPALLPHGADPGGGGGAVAMNSSGLPCSSPSPVVGPPPPAAGVGVAGPAAGGAGAGCGGAVKLKFCRYYAKDKTCFYGEECQFLHEEPGAAPAGPGTSAPLGGLPLGIPPAAAAGPGYPPHGANPGPAAAAAVVGPKKAELGAGGGGGGGLDGPRLASECGGAARGWGRAGALPGGVRWGAGGALFLLPDTLWCYRKQITTAVVAAGVPGPASPPPGSGRPGRRGDAMRAGRGCADRTGARSGDPAGAAEKDRAGACSKGLPSAGSGGHPGSCPSVTSAPGSVQV